MREHRGFSYMRTTREKTPVLYEAGETFEIGGSRTLRSSDDDAVTLIGAGITLHECLDRRRRARRRRAIAARVIDLYSVKPVDADDPADGRGGDRRRWSRSRTTGRRAGSARPSPASSPGPASATPLVSLAVTERPGSGPPEALLAAAGIDAAHIVARGRAGTRPFLALY